MSAGSHTLTYNYGETPEEVIRERLTLSRRFNAQALSLPTLTGGGVNWQMTDDDLLTVLDALVLAAHQRVWTNEPDTYAKEKARQQRAKDLRRSILSALGIEES